MNAAAAKPRPAMASAGLEVEAAPAIAKHATAIRPMAKSTPGPGRRLTVVVTTS